MVEEKQAYAGLTPKQRQCLELLRGGGLRRINILQGSVRSGKTYASLLLWAFWVAVMPRDGAYLMAARTMMTLKRNVLDPLVGLCSEGGFAYSLQKKEAVLYGRVVYLEGVSDTRSEGKIRGLTLDGAYCDELTLFDEEFFIMLLSRLSKPGAKLFATTNPDHPGHWLKRSYLDNKKLDLLSVGFSIEDNCFLDPQYVASLKKEYSGMYYDRFVRGLWVAAEGRVYPQFSRDKHTLGERALKMRLAKSPVAVAVVGVDYGGNRSASVFCLVGFDQGFQTVYVLREYYDKANRSAEHLIEAFRRKIEEWRGEFPRLSAAYCDSAEQLLVKSFRAAAQIEVRNALKRPVNSRIGMVGRLISSGRLVVHKGCGRLVEALENAVWGEGDVRLDNGSTNIDSLDAFEYAVERFEGQLFKI